MTMRDVEETLGTRLPLDGSAVWVHVTPEKAHALLRFNVGNRPIAPSHLRWLASEMSAGRWKRHHQGIAFSDSGVLIDGQHRLKAVCVSQTSQWFLASGYQSDATAFLTMDHSRPRSASDAIAVEQGVSSPRAAKLAAAARFLAAFEEYRSTGVFRLKTGRAAHIDQLDLVRRWPTLGGSIDKISAMKKTGRIVTPAAAIAAHCLFAQIDPAAADAMFEQVLSQVGLVHGSPILTLVRFLQRGRGMQSTLVSSNGDIARQSEFAAYVRTWNALRSGETLGKMYARPLDPGVPV